MSKNKGGTIWQLPRMAKTTARSTKTLTRLSPWDTVSIFQSYFDQQLQTLEKEAGKGI